MEQFAIDGGAFMRLATNLFKEIQKKFKGYGLEIEYVSESDGVLQTKKFYPGIKIQITNLFGISVKVSQETREKILAQKQFGGRKDVTPKELAVLYKAILKFTTDSLRECGGANLALQEHQGLTEKQLEALQKIVFRKVKGVYKVDWKDHGNSIEVNSWGKSVWIAIEQARVNRPSSDKMEVYVRIGSGSNVLTSTTFEIREQSAREVKRLSEDALKFFLGEISERRLL